MEQEAEIKARKRALRRTTIELIRGLDPSTRRDQESRLAERFPGLPGYAAARTVLLYVKAFPEELETRPFFELAQSRDQRIVCPLVDRGERRLRLFEVRSLVDDLVPGTLGIPEPRVGCLEVSPEEVDWVLVPGLVFDRRCERLGRGAGHYDRLIPRLRPDVSRWAIGFDCQLVAELPVEPHDVPVHGVVTPSEMIQRD